MDEADVIETDGNHIYLLQGSEFLTIDSLPAEATALRSRTPIEGYPSGMFVADNRAAVVSQVLDPGSLGGANACRWIDSPFPVPMPLVASGFVDAATRTRLVATCAPTFTKLTLLDLTGANPRVAREIYFEGAYTAARRVGNVSSEELGERGAGQAHASL